MRKQINRPPEVIDGDSNVIHPFDCHVPNHSEIRWVAVMRAVWPEVRHGGARKVYTLLMCSWG